MKEADAKKRWCPFTAVILLHRKPGDEKGMSPIASNHPGGKGANCEGSGCMAWRWSAPLSMDEPRDHGYCGLAGPEEMRRTTTH